MIKFLLPYNEQNITKLLLIVDNECGVVGKKKQLSLICFFTVQICVFLEISVNIFIFI